MGFTFAVECTDGQGVYVAAGAADAADAQYCNCNADFAGETCNVDCAADAPNREAWVAAVAGAAPTAATCDCVANLYGANCDFECTDGQGVYVAAGAADAADAQYCNCNADFAGETCNVDCAAGAREAWTPAVPGAAPTAAACPCTTANFFGDACDIECVAATTCNGNGVCGDDGACDCNQGFLGADCSGGQCQGNSDCAGDNQACVSGSCVCGTGFISSDNACVTSQVVSFVVPLTISIPFDANLNNVLSEQFITLAASLVTDLTPHL